MKKILVTAIFLAFQSFYAQSSTIKEALKYYPLNNGDYWEYGHFINDNYVDYPVKPYYWLKVIGDTLLSNGKIYKKIEQRFFDNHDRYWRYERIDTLSSSVYRFYDYDNKEYEIDSLLSKPADKIICSRYFIWMANYTKCLSETDEILFDRYFLVKTMKDYTTTMAYKYKLVKGLGYYYSESSELTFQGEKLLHAKINGVEFGVKTDVNKKGRIPLNFSLSQNYPNPFNPETTIDYQLSTPGFVTLKIYDLLGREVATLVNEYKNAGFYNSQFSIRNFQLVSGVYFYRLQIYTPGRGGSYSETKKLILMK